MWEPCADPPYKGWVISVVELDRKLYAAVLGNRGGYVTPFVYDPVEDRWSSLPALLCIQFSLVAVPDKKQLLAIGGMVNNNGVDEISNKVFVWNDINKKWITLYPNMPTARYHCSSISHGSTVIVAGGITSQILKTVTRAVEVLHIKEHGLFTRSNWSVVEQLPLVVYGAIPLIVNDKLYIAQGYEKYGGASTCNVVTVSLPKLLNSSNKNANSDQVWSKLPDMPYSSFSINHYQSRLITFTGCHMVEQPNEHNSMWKSVSLIHIYNPDTQSWDCVGEFSYGYLLGRSVHIEEDKIVFIGGMTGICDLSKHDDIITTCLVVTLSPHMVTNQTTTLEDGKPICLQ